MKLRFTFSAFFLMLVLVLICSCRDDDPYELEVSQFISKADSLKVTFYCQGPGDLVEWDTVISEHSMMKNIRRFDNFERIDDTCAHTTGQIAFFKSDQQILKTKFSLKHDCLAFFMNRESELIRFGMPYDWGMTLEELYSIRFSESNTRPL